MIDIWTRKTVLILSVGIISAVGSLIFHDYQLLIMAIILMIIISLAFYTTQSRIEVERFLPESKYFENDMIPVVLRISNHGRSLGLVEIYDKLPGVMQITRGENKITLNLRPGEVVDIEYTIRCPLRGFYLLGPVIMRRSDFFSIFNDTLQLQEQSPITIYPKVPDIKEVAIDSRYRKIHPGSVVMKHIGTGTEFHSIRDYVPSDPFKKINWKVSARYRKLMVNQHEVEDVFDAMIFVDARELTRSGSLLRNPLEYSVKAAVALSRTMMKRTNRVGLVTYNNRVRIIGPGIGENQLAMITGMLTGTYSMGNVSIRSAIDIATPYMTPRSPIILISPLDEDTGLKDTIRDLCSKKFNIVIISPSAIDFEFEITQAMHGQSPKYQMVKMERENLLTELRGYGANVIDWMPNKPIEEVLAEVRSS
ncbi:MAG: DUF58 domain-containing protein [Thermoplasmata archaeon]|nr:MAG: DUF58 domain-containing protein [Thermoplasmata archaeon]